MTSNIPEIMLLCMDEDFITAIDEALNKLWPIHATKIKITTINERLNSLPPDTKYDLIVSPANSYGRLDGAFDDAISRFFSPKYDYHALTRTVQLELYDKWHGFAPPGTCTLVQFPEKLKANAVGCHWIAICPTMRGPSDARWDREVVYECVWSLMCAVEGHNRHSGQDRIKKLLMPPIAVGVGRVSKERWADQVVLALMHFVDSVENPAKWKSLDWAQAASYIDEVSKTWE